MRTTAGETKGRARRVRGLRLLLAATGIAALAALGSCGGSPDPVDAGPGTDAAPITLMSDSGASDAGAAGCVPACTGGMFCLHGCSGPPACAAPPMGCSGCSFSCNPCAPGSCGTVTSTDVECVCP